MSLSYPIHISGEVGREGYGERRRVLSPLEKYREDGLLSRSGAPRLTCARSWFLDLKDMDFEGLIEYFKTWKDFREYLVLQKQVWKDGEVERKTVAVKCSKRGNDVYWWRIRKRLGWMKDLKDFTFFDPHANIKETNVLFITLTYDTKRASLQDAWEGIGRDFNSWITNLRQKYGQIAYFRDWEAFINGYPHIHVLMVFHDYKFRCTRVNGKYRIREKAEFEKGYHSFVDVQGMRKLKGGLSYITKYLTKSFHEEAAIEGLKRNLRGLSLAMCWIFRKHSFAVSGDFHDLINDLRNSKGSEAFQIDLMGKRVIEDVVWVFLGIFSASVLGIEDNSWSVELDNAVLGGMV